MKRVLLALVLFVSAIVTAQDGQARELVGQRSFALTGDGGHLFYRATVDGSESIWRRTTAEDGEAERVHAWESGMLHFAVGFDGDSVALLEIRPGEQMPSLSLLRREVSGTWKKSTLLQGQVISAFTGSTLPSFQALTQTGPEDFVRYEWSQDGDLLSTEAYSIPAEDIVFAQGLVPRAFKEAGTGDWRAVHQGAPGEIISLPKPYTIEKPLFVASGSNTLFAFVRGGEHLTSRPIAYRWDTRELTRFPAHARVDVDSVIRSLDGNGIDGVRLEEHKPQTIVLGEALAQDLLFLEAKHGLEPSIIGRSADNEVWLLRVDFKDRPSETWLHKHSSKSSFRLDGSELVELADVVPPSRYTLLKSEDGFDLPAYLAPPVASACDIRENACPLAVHIHGGPARRDRLAYDPESARLQRQGFWVLRVNYRGSRGFGDVFERAADRQWGRKVISDIHDAVEWASSVQGVDASKITSVGASFGGFAAIAVATMYPSHYRCAASINGGGDLVQFARAGRMRATELARGIAMQVGDPTVQAELEDIEQQSPMTRVGELEARVFLAAALNDTVSDPLQTLNYADALSAAGKTFELVRLEDSDHALSNAAERQYLHEELAKFLRECR